jgi:hypothetical protein
MREFARQVGLHRVQVNDFAIVRSHTSTRSFSSTQRIVVK